MGVAKGRCNSKWKWRSQVKRGDPESVTATERYESERHSRTIANWPLSFMQLRYRGRRKNAWRRTITPWSTKDIVDEASPRKNPLRWVVFFQTEKLQIFALVIDSPQARPQRRRRFHVSVSKYRFSFTKAVEQGTLSNVGQICLRNKARVNVLNN